MHWLWDGWPSEHAPDWTVRLASWIGCRIGGHEPTGDQCGKPEHDFCLWCSKSMPFQALRRSRG